MPEPILVIACGALAREIIELKHSQGWEHLYLSCIDARLHNRPEQIPERLRERIRENADRYAKIFVAYADCGSGGGIDRVVAEEGVERLPGAHCYQFYAGTERFNALSEAEPGTFYLTDFLTRHFDRLVIRPLGLDTHPELRDSYFGNYRKLVYLSQVVDGALIELAREAAERLELEFEHVHCGYGELQSSLAKLGENTDGQENTRLLA